MSARMQAVLSCDHNGCEQRFVRGNETAAWKPPSLTNTRRLARADGWTFGIRPRQGSGPAPTVDFCREHAGDIQGDGHVEVTP